MENARLKEILQANGIAYDVVSTYAYEEKVYSDISFPEVHLGKEERIELFAVCSVDEKMCSLVDGTAK